MLKVYVNPLSGPSNKVLFGLHAMNVSHERIVVNLAQGEQREPWFLALNPLGKVPVLVDDGFVLTESSAILCYLARREKSALYPSTYQERALVDQWCSFSNEMIQMAVQRVFFNRVLAPMIGTAVDENAIKVGLHLLGTYLPVVETQLADRRYVCGDSFTLADLSLLAALDSAAVADIDLAGYPHLSAWQNRMSTQDFYTQTHARYGAGILDRG